MAQRSSSYRYSMSPAKPVGSRRPRRALRKLVWFAVIVGILVFLVRAYILQVYAPGLQNEARTVPALVREELATYNARYLRLSDISPDMQNAIVAIEDRRFYSHPGIDPLGIIRALWVNMTQRHVDQGGSTLEEQLVKRAIVHQDRSIHDKLRTMALAWAVDLEFSKHQILELYLNAAYYGQGAYGVGEGARVYFGTDALHLSLPQAAFLAALPQAPSVYGAHPTDSIVVARERTVLKDMHDLGYITSAQEQAAVNSRLTFAFPNP